MEYSGNEFIKLNRKIKNWRWFCDVNTAHFFIYCLLSANWKDGYFKNIKVERGQFVRTYENMSAESGLSKQNIRTAIKHLKLTGEITVNLTGNGRGATLVITVVKYDDYQQPNTKDNTFPNNQLTSNQHPTNIQSTQIEEVKNIRTKEVKKKDKPPISPFEEIEKIDFSEKIKECLKEWFEYKKQKKEKSYQTEMGFKKFVTQVRDAVERCGEEKVIGQFDYAMSRGWSGAYLDKIEPEKKQGSFDADSFMRRFEE